MNNKKKVAKTKADKSQVEAFQQTARDIGADRPADLDDVMKRLAGQKRSPKGQSKERN